MVDNGENYWDFITVISNKILISISKKINLYLHIHILEHNFLVYLPVIAFSVKNSKVYLSFQI